MMKFSRIILTASALLLSTMVFSAPLYAKNKCPTNCYPMLVMRVIDGDTVQGYIHTSDDMAVIYAKLRLDGIDTPESKRPQCPEEHLLALLAKGALANQLAPIIRSRSINQTCACDTKGGKFARRRIGSLRIKKSGGKKWIDVAKPLISRCYAIAYSGKGPRINWCKCLKSGDCPANKFPAKCIKRFTSKSK